MTTQPQRKVTYLSDLFAEEEELKLAQYRAERLAEQAAWDALPQEQKDRHIAELHRKAEELFLGCGEEE